MQNINASLPTIPTIPITQTLPLITHQTHKLDFTRTDETPLKSKLERRQKREINTGDSSDTNTICGRMSNNYGYKYSVSAITLNKKDKYICLPSIISQNSTMTAQQALSVCNDIGKELKRLKLIGNDKDFKKCKDYCTHSLSNIYVTGNQKEISEVRNALQKIDEINGIDIKRVKNFFDAKDPSKAKETIKQHSNINNLGSNLFGRFYCVATFCALSLYITYMQNYGSNN